MYITDKVAQVAYTFPAPWNYTATNVVLPNGDYDPWHALSAAHCADMYPPYSDEPAGLNATRQIIIREVGYYLNNLQSSTTMSPFTAASTISGGCSDVDTDCQNFKDNCKNTLYKPFMCKYCKQTCNFCFDQQCSSFNFMEIVHKN
uniref:ShKT domain-containing protein n=1 Tax=Panagrolaimus sp. PS1159 TaxID=55785 RepID=A0AC35FSN4_9BILA